MVVIAVDIDGTIADRNLQKFKEVCKQTFELRIPFEELDRMGYRNFVQTTEMVNYRERLGLEKFEQAIEQIEQAPTMLRELPTMPLAEVAVLSLSLHGHVCYYTVRKNSDPETSKAIQQVTKDWLAKNGFPNSQDVVFCRSVIAKLIQLYEREKDHEEPLVLIDDRYNWIIRDFPLLAIHGYQDVADALLKRFTLVAYGAEIIPVNTNGLCVVTLPEWKHVATLTSLVSEMKGIKHGDQNYSYRNP